MSAEKRSVSAPAELFRLADARARQLHYSRFSDYVQALIRADVLREAQAQVDHNAVPPARPELNEPKVGDYSNRK